MRGGKRVAPLPERVRSIFPTPSGKTQQRNASAPPAHLNLGLNGPQLQVYSKIVTHVDDLAEQLQRSKAQHVELTAAAARRERAHAATVAALEKRVAVHSATVAVAAGSTTTRPATTAVLEEELRLARRAVQRLEERSRIGREAAFDAMREAILADAEADASVIIEARTTAHCDQLAALYRRLLGGSGAPPPASSAVARSQPPAARAQLLVQQIEAHVALLAEAGGPSTRSSSTATQEHDAALAKLRGEVRAARGALAREQQERRARTLELQGRCEEEMRKMHDAGVRSEAAAATLYESQRAEHSRAMKLLKRELRRALKSVASLEGNAVAAAQVSAAAFSPVREKRGDGLSLPPTPPAKSANAAANANAHSLSIDVRSLEQKHAEALAAQSAAIEERNAAVVEAQLDQQILQQKVQRLAMKVRRMSPKSKERRKSHNAKVAAAVDEVSRQYELEVSRLRSELKAVQQGEGAAAAPAAASAP